LIAGVIAALVAVVAMSTLTLLAGEPAGRVAGWKMHREKEGSEEQENETLLSKEPPPGTREREKDAVPPAGMVSVSESDVIENFATLLRVTGNECCVLFESVPRPMRSK
jgi:hypothetical protein